VNNQTLLATVLILIFTAFMAWAANNVARFAPPQDILPMTFAHKDHSAENCLVCHHNFQDDTGGGTCIDCHQKDTSVNLIIREQFHTLCMDCHTERSLAGEPAGPLRVCDDCHTMDSLP